MCKLKQIVETLRLVDQYDGQLSKTERELNINRKTLQRWRDKRRKSGPLLERNRKPWSRVLFS